MDFLSLCIIIALALAVISLLYLLLKNKKSAQDNESDKLPEKFPYIRKNLLTKNEWVFFKKLKDITDKQNLHILSKVRLIDLIDIEDNLTNKEKMSYKARIIQKHVDFVLVNPDSFKVYMAIELDDSTHDTSKRKERDEFVNKVCSAAGLPLIHCRNADGLEEKITNTMNELKKTLH